MTRARYENLLSRSGTAWMFVFMLAALTSTGCQKDAPIESTTVIDEARKKTPEELFATALAYAEVGEMLRAEHYFNAARRSGYPEAEVVPWLVRVCVGSNRFNSALSYADPYLTAHPDEWALRFVVANIHDALGNPERARADLERIIAQVPEQAPPHYRLGLLLRERFNEKESARSHFEKYLELSPSGEHADEVREWLTNGDKEPGPQRISPPKSIGQAEESTT